MHLVKRHTLRQATQIFTVTKTGSQVRTVIWLLMLPCSGLVVILVRLLRPVVEWFIMARPIFRPLTDWAKWCNIEFPYFFNFSTAQEKPPKSPTPTISKLKQTDIKMRVPPQPIPIKSKRPKLLPPAFLSTTPLPDALELKALKKPKKSKFNLAQIFLVLNLETKWFKELVNKLHTLQLLSFYEGLFIIQQRVTTSVKNFRLLRNYLTTIVREEHHLKLIKEQLVGNALGKCDLNPWTLINNQTTFDNSHISDPYASLNRLKKRRLMLQSFAR